MPRVQSGQALLFETPVPARNRRPRSTQLDLDLIPTLSVGQCQNQSGPEDIARWQRSRLRPSDQILTMLLAQFGHSMIASHINMTMQTSIGNEMTGTVH